MAVTLPPTSDPTWPFMLGQQFVEAAMQCGFECDRAFVSPRLSPEGMPPDCPCQLAVVVQPGWQGSPGGDPPPCLPRPIARVRVVLDLCVLEAGASEVLTPVQLNTEAAGTYEALWRVLAGIQRARAHGGLGDGDCTTVLPGSWTQLSQEGASVRWVSDWVVLLTPS